MTDKIFYMIWEDAISNSDCDAFVSDWTLSSIWEDPDDADIPQDRIDQLQQIWTAAHMSFADIVRFTGLKQTQFATRYCIPYRTVQNWFAGVSNCPDYMRLLLLRDLHVL